MTLTTFDSFRIPREPIANVFCSRISALRMSYISKGQHTSCSTNCFRSDRATRWCDTQKWLEQSGRWRIATSLLAAVVTRWVKYANLIAAAMVVMEKHPAVQFWNYSSSNYLPSLSTEAFKVQPLFCGRKPQVCTVYCDTAYIPHKFRNLLKTLRSDCSTSFSLWVCFLSSPPLEMEM